VSGSGMALGQQVTVSWRSDAARLLPAEGGPDLGAEGQRP